MCILVLTYSKWNGVVVGIIGSNAQHIGMNRQPTRKGGEKDIGTLMDRYSHLLQLSMAHYFDVVLTFNDIMMQCDLGEYLGKRELGLTPCCKCVFEYTVKCSPVLNQFT